MGIIIRKTVGVTRIKGRHIGLPLLIALLIVSCGEQGRGVRPCTYDRFRYYDRVVGRNVLARIDTT